MSAEERNKRIARTKKGTYGKIAMVPAAFDPYQRVYICTHGWKKRKGKSRSKGKRPRQYVRFTGCPFRFVAQAQQGTAGDWKVVVNLGRFVHNHAVGAATYVTYPCARGVDDDRVAARVDGMLAVGAKRSRIYDYLLDHDQNVIMSDVDNMVRAHASSVSGKDDNDATEAEMAAFAAENPENLISIDETSAGETGVLSLTTAHMRQMFARISELLLVDCSDKTNHYNYQLCTFMTMNEYGEGVAVQHSLLEANSDWHMDRAVDHFKRAHPTRIKLLRVTMVDKDMNEIRVLQNHFPEARVLICHFHAIKYLKEMRSKPEYGGKSLSSEDAAQIDAVVHKMVYASDTCVYDEHYQALRGLCSRLMLTEFFDYFDRNWHVCQDMWVTYRRSKLPHMKNNTNNLLESFFGKLKDCVDGSASMAMCVKALVSADRRAANEYRHRKLRIGHYVNANHDEELANLLRATNHYVADQIAPQYSIGMEKADVYAYDGIYDEPSVVMVRGWHTAYRLQLTDWACECEFAQTMQLPCRHAIAFRRHKGVPGPVIPWSRIDER